MYLQSVALLADIILEYTIDQVNSGILVLVHTIGDLSNVPFKFCLGRVCSGFQVILRI